MSLRFQRGIQFSKYKQSILIFGSLQLLFTVKPVLEAAASNYFDEIFAQNLLSKNCILLRLLFEGGFYLRAASNTGFTVVTLNDCFTSLLVKLLKNL